MADLEKGASILEEESSATARRSEEVTVREEESESESGGGGGGGGGSSRNDQPAAAAVTADDDVIREWLRSIMIDQGKSPNNTMPKHAITIRKVQPTLRSNKCYSPEVVSIGPYHYEKLKSFDELKIRFTKDFCKNDERATRLYGKVAEIADEVRNCYDKDSTKALGDRDFTQMIFLDGCFVSHFIRCLTDANHYSRKTLLKMMKSRDIALVRRDFLLLENQLPFEVLQALMGESSSEDEGSINDFIRQTRLHTKEYLFLGQGDKRIKYPSQVFLCGGAREYPPEYGNEPVHLLEILWRKLIEPKVNDRHILSVSSHWYSRRSAMDLKMVGIHFRPSQTERLTDITFKSSWWTWGGILTLPPINIDVTTISMLSNLVAYETSPGSSAGRLGVTNYICFLDSMIASANDVKELKLAGIISNFLSNDEAAVEAIHGIADGLVPDDTSYSDVKRRIEEYHSHRRKTRIASWISEFMRDHCRSPWTAIAVVAALLILCLTFLQTFFTIFPRK